MTAQQALTKARKLAGPKVILSQRSSPSLGKSGAVLVGTHIILRPCGIFNTVLASGMNWFEAVENLERNKELGRI